MSWRSTHQWRVAVHRGFFGQGRVACLPAAVRGQLNRPLLVITDSGGQLTTTAPEQHVSLLWKYQCDDVAPLTYASNVYAVGCYGNGAVVVGHQQQLFYLLLHFLHVGWCRCDLNLEDAAHSVDMWVLGGRFVWGPLACESVHVRTVKLQDSAPATE